MGRWHDASCRLSRSCLNDRSTPGTHFSNHADRHASVAGTGCLKRNWQKSHLCQVRCQDGLGPDVSQLKPHLQQQWDTAANSHLGNVLISPQCNKKVQWNCQDCPSKQAHVWQAVISSRSNGSGCPYCAGRAVCQHNSLAAQAPNIAAEWDFEANDQTPNDYTSQSSTKAAWKCRSCQHAWRAPIARRTALGFGCPNCGRERARVKTRQPTLAASGSALMANWDVENNELAGLDPNSITLGSHRVVHWVCTKCPLGVKHRWRASPAARRLSTSQPAWCPCCAGQKACKCNCLQTVYPDLAAEWDFARNSTTPADHTASSRFLAWWLNDKRGSWQQSINGRSKCVARRKKYTSTNK